MKKLNRAALSVLGLSLSTGLMFSGVGCSDPPGPPGGSGGVGPGAGGTGAGGIATGSGAVTGAGGIGPGVGGTGAGGIGPGVGGNGAGGEGVGGDAGSGGAPGSGGGGGTMPIPKPALITSTNGDFWNTSGALTMGGTSATITVTSTTELQNWVGWGGTFNEVGWNELSKLDQAERDRIMGLLFSRVDGLGLTWGRIPIGASDYALERYTLCDAPCNADNLETSFSIDHDKNATYGLIPYIQAAQAIVTAESAQYAGVEPTKFWGSAWTPPPWMKDNGQYDKGVMKSDAATLTAYARYLAKWVEAYTAEGIPIDHIHPQNEPGWAQGYPSCAWGPSTDNGTTTARTAFLGTFVADYLVDALAATGLPTTVWYGTFSNSGDDVFPAYWSNLSDKSVIGGIGLQWATENRVETVLSGAAGKTVMQTEHQCGNYPWKGTSNGDGSYSSNAPSADAATDQNFWLEWAPNNYNYGIESWTLLKKWIARGTTGVNAYSAWNMVLDRVGLNLDEIRPWPQNALISFNQDGSTNVTPYYYVFRHVAQYARPGGKRIQTSGGDALAFKNPDGSIMVALYNSGAAAQTTISIDGTMMQFTAPANGWATVNYTPTP